MKQTSKTKKVNELSITPTEPAIEHVPWSSWWGVVFLLLVFFASQILAEVLVSFYPWLKHWSDSQATGWFNNSVNGQFAFVLLAETLAVGAIYLFLRRRKLSLAAIGLKRPRWLDPAYGLMAAPVYYLLLVLAVSLASSVVHGLDINQQQQIGFNNVHGTLQLVLTFVSLVVLPPLAEEIMVRGFLYSSFKKALPVVWAALATSAMFAAAHLPEGGAAGPLYIAAIDTFVLSLVLIYLREKTGSLWASISLHAIKNGAAFVTLFVLHAR
jgi:membrane protease YdiL (CAAX protease family)